MMETLYKRRKLIFGIYCVAMAAMFLITRGSTRAELQEYQNNFGMLPHNYIPFQTIAMYLGRLPSSFAIWNLAGNIMALIPFGILLPWSMDRCRQFRYFFICSAVICLGIEVFQRITLTGSFDIDDVILNVVGCCAGYAVYCGIRKLRKNKRHG